MTAEKSTRKQRAGFAPGKSGNPAGKPPGTRSKQTLLLEAILSDAGRDVLKTLIAAAKKGDTSAARLILERVMPPRRDRPVDLELPPLDSAQALLKAGQAVIAAVGRGEITPGEGDAVLALIERQARLIEVSNLEARIAELEARS